MNTTRPVTALTASARSQRAAFEDLRRKQALAAIAHIQRCYRDGRPIPALR